MKKQIFACVLSLMGTLLTAQSSCTAAFTYTVGSAGQVTFTDASVNTNGNTSWHWGFGDNDSAWSTSPVHNYPYNGNYNVCLKVTDSLMGGTCSSTYCDVVSITNTATCNFSASCTYTVGSNGQVSFTNTSVGTPYWLQWTFGDGNWSTQVSPNHTYSYNGTYIITLFMNDQTNVCNSTFQDTVVITNAAPPPVCNASFTYTLGTNGLVDFTNTSVHAVQNPWYEFSYGDGSANGWPNFTTIQKTYPVNGIYNVSLTIKDSLNVIWCASTQQVHITNSGVNPNCIDSTSFYLVQDTTQVSTWNVYMINSNGTYPLNALWSWGDGTSSSGLFPSHTYASPGWYSICLTAYFACDTTTYCQTDSVYRNSAQMIDLYVINTQNGITSQLRDNSLKAYPNPFTDELKITFNSTRRAIFTGILYDVMGHEILKNKIEFRVGENEFWFDTSELGRGVYFLQISDGKIKNTIKVVK